MVRPREGRRCSTVPVAVLVGLVSLPGLLHGQGADTIDAAGGTDSLDVDTPVSAHAPTSREGDEEPAPGAPLSMELEEVSKPAPAFPEPGLDTSGTVWINSPPLSWDDLRGQVVMIDFMEYSCINCIRTFDDNLRLWRRYHEYGFQIVGVHAPEFEFAYDVENVERAVERFGIPYPVVVDNWFRIWKAYDSNIWPNRFLVDHTGTIRYHKRGEGAEAALEEAVRKLLVEADPGLTLPDSLQPPEPENAFADSCGRTTPEIYVGLWHGRGSLANEKWYRPGEVVDYDLPSSLSDGSVVLEGRWETAEDGMIYRGNKSVGSPEPDQLSLAYTAREVYAVMNVERGGRPMRVYVSQDGRWLTEETGGVDVNYDDRGRSYLYVNEPRMYYLVENPRLSQHFVNLIPTHPGLTVNSFTFGNDCQTDFPHR